MKIDRARGETAPHQIILLATLFDLFKLNTKPQVKLAEISGKFGVIWVSNNHRFSTTNMNLARPVPALA